MQYIRASRVRQMQPMAGDVSMVYGPILYCGNAMASTVAATAAAQLRVPPTSRLPPAKATLARWQLMGTALAAKYLYTHAQACYT